MANYLYANFLENKKVYNLAKAYWGRLLNSVLEEQGYSHTPYINQLQGAKKEYDGNPIFSAYIPEASRAIRVIQVDPKEEGDDLSAWIDKIELNQTSEQRETEELVLDIKLSKGARNIAEELMKKWIKKQLNDSIIDEVLAQHSK
ncbi:MAG: hypothetical protein AAGJ82_03785 [Bacteroidota bacterium]